jgi:hypothetical protein
MIGVRPLYICAVKDAYIATAPVQRNAALASLEGSGVPISAVIDVEMECNISSSDPYWSRMRVRDSGYDEWIFSLDGRSRLLGRRYLILKIKIRSYLDVLAKFIGYYFMLLSIMKL